MTTPKEQSNPVALYMARNLHNRSYATSRSKSEAELFLHQSGLKIDGKESEVVELYEVPPSCNAVAAVALMRAAEVCVNQAVKYADLSEGSNAALCCETEVLALIPADHMQAVRELIKGAVMRGIFLGKKPTWHKEEVIVEVDRILAEKGLI